jgi:hypothetical protein
MQITSEQAARFSRALLVDERAIQYQNPSQGNRKLFYNVEDV